MCLQCRGECSSFDAEECRDVWAGCCCVVDYICRLLCLCRVFEDLLGALVVWSGCRLCGGWRPVKLPLAATTKYAPAINLYRLMREGRGLVVIAGYWDGYWGRGIAEEGIIDWRGMRPLAMKYISLMLVTGKL